MLMLISTTSLSRCAPSTKKEKEEGQEKEEGRGKGKEEGDGKIKG